MSAADLVLYDFQEEAVEALRENIRAGVVNQVLSAPTGSGKTIIATHLIRECYEKGKKALFVADRISLIDQTSAVFDTYGVPHGVIQGNHWRYRPYERIQVASPQTLARRKWPVGVDLLVVDEAHSDYKVNREKLAERETVAIGLTATPFTRGMGRVFDAVVSVTTTHELIRRKRLAPFRVYAPSEPDMTGARVSAGEWTITEASKRSIPIVGDCVREYLRHADGEKFIAFGADVAHCLELQRQFQAAGVQVGVYSYRTPDGERAEMLEEFRKPDSYLRGLCSVAALAKGFDVEDVGCIIMARPLRSSLAEHIQILGRGLRWDPANPSKELVCLDHAGNCLRFWDRMNEFFDNGIHELDDGSRKKKSKRKAEEAKRGRKCPACHHVHTYAPHCPSCGHEYPVPRRIHEKGHLVELGNGASAPRDERQRIFSELLGEARMRGYSEGWVAHTYRAKFGSWPNGLRKETLPPSPETKRWVRHRMIAYAKGKQPKPKTKTEWGERWERL